MKRRKDIILVALSGGVDSSVAAAILVRDGYDVTGAYMVNYDSDSDPAKGKCWAGDYRDALRVAAKLKIPLLRLDFTKEYGNYVLNYLYCEYRAGNTPNPDILCNKFIKFGFWLKKAKQLGFSKLATGHYARLEANKTGCIELLEAKDKNKDQTYFLNQLTQKQLKDVLFPIGDYTKPQVRELAKKFSLPVADKEESMGICFVGEVPMKNFLSKKIKSKPGNVVLTAGEIIGAHDGLAFYTIGQRHIGVLKNKSKLKSQDPLYVVGKNIKANELIVGYNDDPLLHKKYIKVSEINWIDGHKSSFPLKCMVRLRHRQPLQKCTLRQSKNGNNKAIDVEFETKQRAPAAGQFAVFYFSDETSAKSDRGCKCLGGGVIN